MSITMTKLLELLHGVKKEKARNAIVRAKMNNQGNYMQGTTQSPIIEPMQERQINRTIIHQVPHVCPIRTRIINHHIYKHTYCPEYSCCEENVVSNINQGSCCNFH